MRGASIAASAFIFVGVLGSAANAQVYSPGLVSSEMAAFRADASAICLSPQQKANDLNSGNRLLAALKFERDPSLARELSQLLYDIRSKPPCNPLVIPYTGGFALKDWTHEHIEERLGADGHLTNQFDVVKDPAGGGVDFGVYFPWTSTVRVGPYASIGFLNLPAYHNFSNGNYLGTTTHWMAQIGGKAGVMITPSWFVYGLTALSLINEEVKIYLGGPVTSQNKTVPGVALGGGLEYTDTTWRLFGLQLGVYGEYNHTWSDTARVNAPAASPTFNYKFRREDDTIKVGVHVYLR